MTNAVGRWRARKERRRAQGLPPEHDFSVIGVGISVLCVVLIVMFSV